MPFKFTFGGDEIAVFDDLEGRSENIQDFRTRDALVFSRGDQFRRPAQHDPPRHLAAALVRGNDRDIFELIQVPNGRRNRFESRLERLDAQNIARDSKNALEGGLVHVYVIGRSRPERYGADLLPRNPQIQAIRKNCTGRRAYNNHAGANAANFSWATAI